MIFDIIEPQMIFDIIEYTKPFLYCILIAKFYQAVKIFTRLCHFANQVFAKRPNLSSVATSKRFARSNLEVWLWLRWLRTWVTPPALSKRISLGYFSNKGLSMWKIDSTSYTKLDVFLASNYIFRVIARAGIKYLWNVIFYINYLCIQKFLASLNFLSQESTGRRYLYMTAGNKENFESFTGKLICLIFSKNRFCT